MAGVFAWGWYPTGKIWLPIVVNDAGKIEIAGVEDAEISQATPEDMKHLPHAQVTGDGVYKPFQLDASDYLMVAIKALEHLNDIGDVNAPAPADGDMLVWDTATGTWIPIAHYVADGHKILIVYERVNIAANLTNSDVKVVGSTTFNEVWPPFPGSVIGLSARANAVRTAGTLTITITKGSVEGTLSTTIDAGNPLLNYATQAKDIDTFNAMDSIGVSLTTDAAWAPTTMDIMITVIAEI